MVAVIVVIGLPAVGVVMMAALLIIPGVSARFWSDRLSRVVLLAAVFGTGMGLVGTAVSATYAKMPAGPIITLVGTAVFAVSALAAPRRGLVARVVARQRDRWRADYSEVVRLLFESCENGAARFDDLCGAKSWSRNRVRQLLSAAIRSGDVGVGSGSIYHLTAAGQAAASEVVRRHRLWRLLIAEYPDLVPLARPLTSEPVEDLLPVDVVADLTAKLRAAGQWPSDTLKIEHTTAGAVR